MRRPAASQHSHVQSCFSAFSATCFTSQQRENIQPAVPFSFPGSWLFQKVPPPPPLTLSPRPPPLLSPFPAFVLHAAHSGASLYHLTLAVLHTDEGNEGLSSSRSAPPPTSFTSTITFFSFLSASEDSRLHPGPSFHPPFRMQHHNHRYCILGSWPLPPPPPPPPLVNSLTHLPPLPAIFF